MKNTTPDTSLHLLAHEELQRLAREELARELTDRELRLIADQLQHGDTAIHAIETMIHAHMHDHA